MRAWAAVDETIRVDGYNWVKKAMAMTAPSAEMEFAASLMTQGAVASAHRARAVAAAPKGSIVARNLAARCVLNRKRTGGAIDAPALNLKSEN